jgi:hypothetical protein
MVDDAVSPPRRNLFSGHVTEDDLGDPLHIAYQRTGCKTPATIRQSLPGWLVQPEAQIRRLTRTAIQWLLPGRLARPEAKFR